MLPLQTRCLLFLLASQMGNLKADSTEMYTNNMKPFVRHYEMLSYDRAILNQKHERAKRATEDQEALVELEFHAYERTFKMRLKRDTAAFSDTFEVAEKGNISHFDISFLYSGELQGEKDSVCSGSIINGLFEGSIQTKNGTYYIEPTDANMFHGNFTAHSYIYHENDIDYSLLESVNSSLVQEIYQKLNKWGSDMELKEESFTRLKRSVDISRTTCLLYVKVDYLFCKRFGSVERVIAQIDGLFKAANSIYEKAEFGGIKQINFKVKKLDIFTDRNPADPMDSSLIGVEKLLELHSEGNWNTYCLSYIFTNRDYSGVLGLAFEGKIGNYGGICSKNTKLANTWSGEVTRNTGLVTVQSFGQPLPPRVVSITLAHELAHSLGAPHDGGQECSRFEAENTHGKYLMFPYAVDETQYSNNWFSPCTIDFVGKILHAKKDQCFVESGLPICGNRLVEKGEECDVGNSNTAPCCFGSNHATPCKLKPGKICSPSQGLCCNHECTHVAAGQLCQKESECALESYCTGTSATCSKPSPKPNHTICNLGTKICFNGLCLLSLCAKFGLEKCDCQTTSMYEKCQLCCQQPGNSDTCASTSSSIVQKYFNGSRISLPPGSPCGDSQGYCDKFHMCRLVDADGPIARLKNSILKLKEIEDIASWMKARWWAILLIILTMAAIMAGTVFLFGRTLDSEKGKPQARTSQKNEHWIDGGSEELKAALRKPAEVQMVPSVIYLEHEERFIQSSFIEYESRM